MTDKDILEIEETYRKFVTELRSGKLNRKGIEVTREEARKALIQNLQKKGYNTEEIRNYIDPIFNNRTKRIYNNGTIIRENI